MDLLQTTEKIILLVSNGDLLGALKMMEEMMTVNRNLFTEHYTTYLSISHDFHTLKKAKMRGSMTDDSFRFEVSKIANRLIDVVIYIKKEIGESGFKDSNATQLPAIYNINQETELKIASVLNSLKDILTQIEQRETTLKSKVEEVSQNSDRKRIDLLEIEIKNLQQEINSYKQEYDEVCLKFENLYRSIERNSIYENVEDPRLIAIMDLQIDMKYKLDHQEETIKEIKKIAEQARLTGSDAHVQIKSLRASLYPPQQPFVYKSRLDKLIYDIRGIINSEASVYIFLILCITLVFRIYCISVEIKSLKESTAIKIDSLQNKLQNLNYLNYKAK